MEPLSLTVQKLRQMLKFFCRQTERQTYRQTDKQSGQKLNVPDLSMQDIKILAIFILHNQIMCLITSGKLSKNFSYPELEKRERECHLCYD